MSTRTTVVLEDDVMSDLKEVVSSRHRPFREVLNEIIRKGLRADAEKPPVEPFVIKPINMGAPLVSCDSISKLIEIAEGPLAR